MGGKGRGGADLEVVWGDLGREGGGTQSAGGHLVKHASDEATVLRVPLCCVFFTCLLLISTAEHSGTQSEAWQAFGGIMAGIWGHDHGFPLGKSQWKRLHGHPKGDNLDQTWMQGSSFSSASAQNTHASVSLLLCLHWLLPGCVLLHICAQPHKHGSNACMIAFTNSES